MSSVKDVDQQKFVVGFADFLKKSGKMSVPEWADLIKLSRFNEQGPHNPDWLVESILRDIVSWLTQWVMIDENTWLILPMYHREKTICEAAKPGARGCNFKLSCSIMNLHVTYGAVFSLHWQTIYSLLRFYVRAASVARHLYCRISCFFYLASGVFLSLLLKQKTGIQKEAAKKGFVPKGRELETQSVTWSVCNVCAYLCVVIHHDTSSERAFLCVFYAFPNSLFSRMCWRFCWLIFRLKLSILPVVFFSTKFGHNIKLEVVYNI